MLLITAVTEYVFKPSRRKDGKRVVSRLWRGRFSMGAGSPWVSVSLHTTDRRVAQKRLRDIVVERQMEMEGMIGPRVLREAQVLPLVVLLADYKADLVARELADGHVRETIARIEKIAAESKWVKLSDVRADSFVRFRASLRCSAKTKKEYQTSINAFLNWCRRTKRLVVNPLAEVDRIDTRGKSVRPSRPFTVEELLRLFAVSVHAVFYQTLLYTGQRVSEVAALAWSDLNLDSHLPSVLFREGTMKDNEKRAVPLHAKLAEVLRIFRTLNAQPNDLVFPNAPTYETLRADLKRASIDHKDSLGRVVHLHAFRKTFQTMGVRAGINQRAAQELLGHSDPSLTANVYTDVASLQLHDEVAKLPWISSSTQAHTGAHKDVRSDVRIRKIVEIVAELVSAVKCSALSQDTKAEPVLELAARHGFEP